MREQHIHTDTNLKVLHLNARGLNIPAKRERLFTLLTEHAADVAVLTETWLNSQVDISTNRYRVYRSQPGKHQGVAIALNKSKFEFAKLLHQDLHTVHTMALQVQSKTAEQGRRQQIIVVGHYSQPAVKEQCWQELQFFVTNLRRDHPGIPLIMAGDLNAQRGEARDLIRRINLVQSQPRDADSFHSLQQGNGHRS